MYKKDISSEILGSISSLLTFNNAARPMEIAARSHKFELTYIKMNKT